MITLIPAHGGGCYATSDKVMTCLDWINVANCALDRIRDCNHPVNPGSHYLTAQMAVVKAALLTKKV